ncbi:hypothetical protein L211DRAFT_403195 [Terfezia boudieri ATCC MYA-4762]|uniref:Uncharacterized protein n=1 Tax=Terfezia boudieri ATCC MYA-4762 TaxID=1051890 RepID=A0A3N4M0T8_9PEZI|nr:hypothetical protein L211DRAFT_403195 [Terfezia boudieri ATCC MYA-4762]
MYTFSRFRLRGKSRAWMQTSSPMPVPHLFSGLNSSTQRSSRASVTEHPGATPEKIREGLLQPRCRTPVDRQHRIICLAEVQVGSKVHHETPKQKSQAKQLGVVGDGGSDIVYAGRTDYVVALRDPTTQGLTSYLILVEAKRDSEFSKARSQALGYTACIWEARKAKGVRLDCTTYGLATDGLKWQLLMINHDGIIKEGQLLDARLDGWTIILSMLVAAINRAAQLQTPKNSPTKFNCEKEKDDDSEVIISQQSFYEDDSEEEDSEILLKC